MNTITYFILSCIAIFCYYMNYVQHEDLFDWDEEARVAVSVPEQLLVNGRHAVRRMIETSIQSINQRIITVAFQNLSFHLDNVEFDFIMETGMCNI